MVCITWILARLESAGLKFLKRLMIPQPTGLLDVHGNELFRVTEKRPIGFRVLKEY